MSVYRCGKCGRVVRELRDKIRCPYCEGRVLYGVRSWRPKLTELEREALEVTARKGPVSAKEVAARADAKDGEARRALDALKEKGLIEAKRGVGHRLTKDGRLAASSSTVRTVKSREEDEYAEWRREKGVDSWKKYEGSGVPAAPPATEEEKRRRQDRARRWRKLSFPGGEEE